MATNHIVLLILQYKYLILIPLAIIEGPILSFIAGFLVSTHVLNIWVVFLIIIGGDAIGDTLHYCLGRFGGEKFFRHFGKYIGVTPEDVIKKKAEFLHKARRTVLMGKFVHGVGIALLCAAGMAEVPYLKFLRFALVGALIQSTILVTAGYFFGRLYSTFSAYFYYESIAILCLAIIGAIVYVVIRKKRKKRLAQ